VLHAQPSNSPWFDHFNNIWWTAESMKLVSMKCSPSSCHFIPLMFKYSPQHPYPCV
jgi:hypothetical protein